MYRVTHFFLAKSVEPCTTNAFGAVQVEALGWAALYLGNLPKDSFPHRYM
jgi:hypothetical protein